MRGALVLALVGCGRIAFDPLSTNGTVEPSCDDVVQNGDETGIDCGGSCAAACPGATCSTDADCVTGRCEGTCELEDLTWQPGPSLVSARYDHACATRSDGTVVVVGGKLVGNVITGDVELLTPISSAFTTAAPLMTARTEHAVAVTADGRIVAFAGFDGATTTTSVEIHNGASWSAGAPMPSGARSVSATRAANGWLYAPDLAETIIYDPENGTWDVAEGIGRDQYGIASDGPFVYAIAGGGAGKTPRVDAYDITTQSWSARASAWRDRDDLAAVRAPDGRLYAVGGSDPTTIGITLVEAYTPARDVWRTLPPLGQGRSSLCATLADDGRVFVIGGSSTIAMPAATELYGPVLALDVSSAPVGASVGLMVSGFAPNATLSLMFDGVLVATAMTGTSGSTSASFVVPLRPSGAYRVTAIDQRSQYPVTRRLQIP